MDRCDVGSESTCEQREGDWQHTVAIGAFPGKCVGPCCTSTSAAAVAVDELAHPIFFDGVVALARALQASRFAASAGAVEANCEAATAPTLEKFVSDR